MQRSYTNVNIGKAVSVFDWVCTIHMHTSLWCAQSDQQLCSFWDDIWPSQLDSVKRLLLAQPGSQSTRWMKLDVIHTDAMSVWVQQTEINSILINKETLKFLLTHREAVVQQISHWIIVSNVMRFILMQVLLLTQLF